MPIDPIQPIVSTAESALINNTVALLKIGAAYWSETSCNPLAITDRSTCFEKLRLSRGFDELLDRARQLGYAPVTKISAYLTDARPATITEVMLEHAWGRRLVAYCTVMTELVGQRSVMDELPLFANGAVRSTFVEPLRNAEFVACTWPGLAVLVSEQVRTIRNSLVEGESEAMELVPELAMADAATKARFVMRCSEAADDEIVEFRNTRGLMDRVAMLCLLGDYACEIRIAQRSIVVGNGEVRIRARYDTGLDSQIFNCRVFSGLDDIIIPIEGADSVRNAATAPKYQTSYHLAVNAQRRLRRRAVCEKALLVAFSLGTRMMRQLAPTVPATALSKHLESYRSSLTVALEHDVWDMVHDFTEDVSDVDPSSLVTVSDWFTHSSVVRTTFQQHGHESLGDLSHDTPYMKAVMLCVWIEVIFGPPGLSMTIDLDELDLRSPPLGLQEWIASIPSYLEAYSGGPVSRESFGRMASIVCDGNRVFAPRILLSGDLPGIEETLVFSTAARLSLRNGTLRALHFNEDRRSPAPDLRVIDSVLLQSEPRCPILDTSYHFTSFAVEGGAVLYEVDMAGLPCAVNDVIRGLLAAIRSSTSIGPVRPRKPIHKWTPAHPITGRFPPSDTGRLLYLVRGNGAAQRVALSRSGLLCKPAYISHGEDTWEDTCSLAEDFGVKIVIF